MFIGLPRVRMSHDKPNGSDKRDISVSVVSLVMTNLSWRVYVFFNCFLIFLLELKAGIPDRYVGHDLIQKAW